MKPWDKIMTAAQSIEDQSEDGVYWTFPLAWFLRREAGMAAYRFVELTGKGLADEHALSLAADDAGFVVADATAHDILSDG